jgi:hypothetical protein
MKTYEGVDVELHTFLPSALYRREWLASSPGRFFPRKERSEHRLSARLGEICAYLRCLYREFKPHSSVVQTVA